MEEESSSAYSEETCEQCGDVIRLLKERESSDGAGDGEAEEEDGSLRVLLGRGCGDSLPVPHDGTGGGG